MTTTQLWSPWSSSAFLTRATARRIAGALAGRDRRRGHRPAAGLLVHGEIPGMGRLRAGDRAGPRDLRDLCPLRGSGARRDAAGRRAEPRGPAGAPPWET